LKKNNFQEVPHGLKGQKSQITVLSGFTGVLNNLLKNNVKNSEECFRRLLKLGYTGGVTTHLFHLKAKSAPPVKRVVCS